MSKFQDRGRGGLILAAVLGVLLAVAVASVATAGKNKEEACVDNLCFKAGGAFKPRKLSKRKQTPIGLVIEGKVRSTDPEDPHPPALREAVIETDKNGAVDVKGYPRCDVRKIQSTDSKAAERACGPAKIGEGKTTVGIKLADQPEIDARSKLIVFNGGIKGGTTTLYIHAYLRQPVPAAIVTTVKIKRIHHGRYGLESVATIPKIASGNGSVKYFKLEINKKFTYKHKRRSVLTARCPDGRLQAHAVSKFENGLKLATEFVRPCVGKK
jgi:hypothetical protein